MPPTAANWPVTPATGESNDQRDQNHQVKHMFELAKTKTTDVGGGIKHEQPSHTSRICRMSWVEANSITRPIPTLVKTNISFEVRTFPSSAALSSFRWEGSSVFS